MSHLSMPSCLEQVIHNADGTATVTDLTVVDISQPLRKSRNFGNTAKAGGKKGGLSSSSLAASRKGLTTALPDRVHALLAEAMTKRSIGCTHLNEQSSRSHMVFTMKIDGVNEARGKRSIGVLNLIDLAGSERVKDSGSTGIRLKEAQAINTSLSALGKSVAKCKFKDEGPHVEAFLPISKSKSSNQFPSFLNAPSIAQAMSWQPWGTSSLMCLTATQN